MENGGKRKINVLGMGKLAGAITLGHEKLIDPIKSWVGGTTDASGVKQIDRAFCPYSTLR